MSVEAKYRIVLLDKEGFETGEREADNLREANAQVRYLLSDAYARAGETTHECMRTYKAEVRNAAGECIADVFL